MGSEAQRETMEEKKMEKAVWISVTSGIESDRLEESAAVRVTCTSDDVAVSSTKKHVV
jgi:hypothetical protein